MNLFKNFPKLYFRSKEIRPYLKIDLFNFANTHFNHLNLDSENFLNKRTWNLRIFSL